MANPVLTKAILHYQQCLEKYTSRNDEPRMLYCITKLYKMPITIEHLEKTGVGRTVNALRKANGEIGDAAKSLVAKWKEMVGGGQTPKDSSIKTESSRSHKHESKEKYKDRSSSSSHKESDTANRHESKERSRASSYNEEESVHTPKKEREESKHRKHEGSDKKEKESRSHKHKSSKRKQDSEQSNSEESEYEDRNDNKASKYKSEDSSDEEEYHHKEKKDKKDSYKYKSSKRKLEDSDSDNEYEEVNIKHKRYSEDEELEEESEEEVKKQPSKHHSKQKDEHRSESREKSKRESKFKEKKDKKEYPVEDKAQKEVDNHTNKDKHSHKDKAKSSSSNKNRDDKGTDKKSKHSSSRHHSKDKEKEHKSKKSSSHSSRSKVSMPENGIDSGSGASFAEALGMIVPGNSKTGKKKVAVIHPFPVEKSTKTNNSLPCSPKIEPVNLLIEKKLEPLEINVANLLPEITPNYRPLGNLPFDNGSSKSKMTTDDEALSAILYSKILRTKVYSGNKVIWGKVPTLFDLCTHVLQDNIDALEYTGGVPYSILKPVIERASADQLFALEHHNPYLIEDTDELWQFHCQKEFRNKRREEMETWRDMYMRCLDEREAKLKALTANIKQSQDKSLPVRQTKLAYVDSVVKPPRAVARKQAKHGTGGSDKKPLVTPSSRLSTLAVAGAAGQIAVPNPGARASSTTGNSNAAMKVKKAPLMQKTLAFMKNRCFRR